MQKYCGTFLTHNGHDQWPRFFGPPCVCVVKTVKAISVDAVALLDASFNITPVIVTVLVELHTNVDSMVDMVKPYMFILISSVLTWARSKPVDPVTALFTVLILILFFHISSALNDSMLCKYLICHLMVQCSPFLID